MTFHTRSANETVVAAGVLLITVYLQSHVLYTLTLLGQLIIPVLSQLAIVIIYCIICLSVCVMFHKVMFNEVSSTRSEWQFYYQ